MRSLDPNYDLNWDLVAFERATIRRYELIACCSLFGVEHNERTNPFVSVGGPFTSLHPDGNEQISSTIQMGFHFPRVDARPVREHFKRARIDVLRAELLVRQLLANSNTASGATDAPPPVDVDSVLFYRRDLSCRCCTSPLPVTMQLPS